MPQAGTSSTPATLAVNYHRKLPQIPKMNINMPNINMPQMMNISSYIPEMRTPAFLKDVYALPVQVGGHINRGVHSIGDNLNKVYETIKVNNSCFFYNITKT